MPEFVKPFSGMVPDRKMTNAELVRAMRLNLSAEEEATHLYMAHADATDNPVAKAVLIDIANEERVHVGEFARLIQILTGDEDDFLAKGTAEVDTMAAKVGGQPAAGQQKPEPTIGSLK
ncbi:MAG TPA: ferritin family protein [Methanoregula sp.]|nr:ferritin family protein [Methanoregula sp.]